jgi:hypothetical protein
MEDQLDRIAERIIDQNYDLYDTCLADMCSKPVEHVEAFIMDHSKQLKLDSDFRKKITYLPYKEGGKITVSRIFRCPVHGRMLKIEEIA